MTAGGQRDRLAREGAERLADAELFALVVGGGGAAGEGGAEADAGRRLFERFGSIAGLDRASFRELCATRGIGPARAAALKAALEVGRRLAAGGGPRSRYSSSREVAAHFAPRLANLTREVFLALLLTARHEVIREVTVSIGCLTGSLVHPREVFQPAVRDAAAAVILVHNHPSGDPTPSPEDVQLTGRLVDAGRLIGIRVLDHVVVARDGYASLMEGGEGVARGGAPAASGARRPAGTPGTS